MSTAFRIEVPATSANLGPGYDSFGLALAIHDCLTLTIADAPVPAAACVSVEGEGAEVLPRDRSHLIMAMITDTLRTEYGARADAVLDRLALHCTNRIPHSRGLGSSAAAVVAGIALAGAVGEHLGGPELGRQRVLELATAVEGHPDNAAPAIFGGLTVSLGAPARSWQLPARTVTEVTVLIPDTRLDTDIARSVIPASIGHEVAAENSARTALLVHGFGTDASVLFEATEDRLHQEFRRDAYPESMDIVDRLRAKGLPTVISGAGPTVLVLAHGIPAETLAEALPESPVTVQETTIDLGGYRIARSG